jgi:hypothetical protein
MDIKWNLVEEKTPPVNIEFIAYNPDRGTRKLSASMKFSETFTEKQIISVMNSDDYTHWAVLF